MTAAQKLIRLYKIKNAIKADPYIGYISDLHNKRKHKQCRNKRR